MLTFSQEQLTAAFERVENPEDWRAPINTIIPATEMDKDLISQAITHFTACVAKWTDLGKAGLLPGERVYQVRAVGYRNGPAGP